MDGLDFFAPCLTSQIVGKVGLVAVSASDVWASVGGFLDGFSSVIKLALSTSFVVILFNVFAQGADSAEQSALLVFCSEDPTPGALSEADLFFPRSRND